MRDISAADGGDTQTYRRVKPPTNYANFVEEKIDDNTDNP